MSNRMFYCRFEMPGQGEMLRKLLVEEEEEVTCGGRIFESIHLIYIPEFHSVTQGQQGRTYRDHVHLVIQGQQGRKDRDHVHLVTQGQQGRKDWDHIHLIWFCGRYFKSLLQ